MATLESCVIRSEELVIDLRDGNLAINPEEFNLPFKRIATDETKTKINMSVVKKLTIHGIKVTKLLTTNIVNLILKKQLIFLYISHSDIAARYFRKIMAALKKNPQVEVVFNCFIIHKREQKIPSKFFFKDMLGRKKMLQSLVGCNIPTRNVACSMCLKETTLSNVFLSA